MCSATEKISKWDSSSGTLVQLILIISPITAFMSFFPHGHAMVMRLKITL